jgi:hypothetical protein
VRGLVTSGLFMARSTKETRFITNSLTGRGFPSRFGSLRPAPHVPAFYESQRRSHSSPRLQPARSWGSMHAPERLALMTTASCSRNGANPLFNTIMI